MRDRPYPTPPHPISRPSLPLGPASEGHALRPGPGRLERNLTAKNGLTAFLSDGFLVSHFC